MSDKWWIHYFSGIALLIGMKLQVNFDNIARLVSSYHCFGTTQKTVNCSRKNRSL